MQFIPVKTRILTPPQDDFFAVLDECLADLKDGDVVVISSKVVAIGEGECVRIDNVDKQDLIKEEADVAIPRDYWKSPLTIKHSAFIATAGIDESNADGHYILLPKDPFSSAQKIHQHLKEKFSLKNLGVIISDSHTTPFRRGAIGVSVGFWGIKPTINHIGERDLFGREMEVEVSNLIDGITAGANVVMGEVDESTPVVIARDVPNLVFTDENFKDELLCKFENDIFRVLYERFLT